MKNLYRISIVFLCLAVFSTSASEKDRYIALEYDHWRIVYNCTKRGYEWFYYSTGQKSGSYDRYRPFHHERKLPEECRQFRTSSYRQSKDAEIQYDRGHGVHQNLWDFDKSLMKESNSMANIVPQASGLNRAGVWRHTEILTECYRDQGKVYVWGGVIWGNDASNDHFLESHGVVTPDYLWRLMIYPGGEVNAWIMPNDNTPVARDSDNFLVSPHEISRLTGVRFPLEEEQMFTSAQRTMPKPNDCRIN